MPTGLSGAVKPVLIYILGSGRSGSTILSRLLGTQPEVVTTGEVLNYFTFFESAEEQNRLCSCGASLSACTFWRGVSRRVASRLGECPADLKTGDADQFAQSNSAVLGAILAESGKRVLVDASKRFDRLRRLQASGLFDIRVVHLLRDPRAYAYSSLLTERRKGHPASVFYRKLLRWQNKNLGIRTIYARQWNYTRLRYEDLVRAPEAALRKVLDCVDMTPDLEFLAGSRRVVQHEFSGNKRVFGQQSLSLTFDRRYLSELSARQWLAATTLTLPGLAAFGYPLSRTAPGGDDRS